MITQMQLNAFLKHAIAPVLDDLGRLSPALGGLAPCQLLLLTVVAESGPYFPAIVQEGGGPARGPFQMEPSTHDDIWNRWLNPRHPELVGFMGRQIWWAPLPNAPTSSTMAWNHRYAAAMARMQYWRRPEAHPPAGDAAAMAAYYKRFYNTAGGAADEAAAEILFRVHVAPLIHT